MNNESSKLLISIIKKTLNLMYLQLNPERFKSVFKRIKRLILGLNEINQ